MSQHTEDQDLMGKMPCPMMPGTIVTISTSSFKARAFTVESNSGGGVNLIGARGGRCRLIEEAGDRTGTFLRTTHADRDRYQPCTVEDITAPDLMTEPGVAEVQRITVVGHSGMTAREIADRWTLADKTEGHVPPYSYSYEGDDVSGVWTKSRIKPVHVGEPPTSDMFGPGPDGLGDSKQPGTPDTPSKEALVEFFANTVNMTPEEMARFIGKPSMLVVDQDERLEARELASVFASPCAHARVAVDQALEARAAAIEMGPEREVRCIDDLVEALNRLRREIIEEAGPGLTEVGGQ